MKKLTDCEWKSYFLNDIFTISSSVRLTKQNMIQGTTPFIGASDSNNGITAYVGNVNSSLDSNVLGVNYNGSVVGSFYHPYKALFSDDVKRLHLKYHEDNKYVLLFAKQSILKQKVKFQYGYKFNGERMQRQLIMLPSKSDGTPDYDYMEEYMRAKEIELLDKYRNYLNNNELSGGGQLTEHEWRPFRIEDICAITSGQDIYDRERVSGETPYITATATNNGIGYFVGNSNETLAKNCISVNRNGSVGYAFYHGYEALYGNDTRKLVPFHKNKYSSLFIVRAILQQKEKFGYGYKMGTGRLKRQDIMLPAKSDGSPDYEYMEEVMKTMEHRLIKSYVDKKLQGVMA